MPNGESNSDGTEDTDTGCIIGEICVICGFLFEITGVA
mgnify:CR=1 FL=1